MTDLSKVKAKTKKIRYWIDCRYEGKRQVSGFAVDFAPVRFCVREDVLFRWHLDHYDTGRFFGPLCDSKDEAIQKGIEILNRNLASGRYAEVVDMVNRGEI